MDQAVKYSETSRINFGDLDPYGHLNAKHYLDIVASARLRFLQNRFGLNAQAIAERGYGWFLKESTIKYKRPISGLVDVKCHSRVIRYDDGLLEITFEIVSLNGETEHSTGVNSHNHFFYIFLSEYTFEIC